MKSTPLRVCGHSIAIFHAFTHVHYCPICGDENFSPPECKEKAGHEEICENCLTVKNKNEHAPDCPVNLDDESDQVFYDYQQCACKEKSKLQK